MQQMSDIDVHPYSGFSPLNPSASAPAPTSTSRRAMQDLARARTLNQILLGKILNSSGLV